MKTLLSLLETIDGSAVDLADVAVHNITTDSRQVVPGSLFVALRGTKIDGHTFLADRCSG
jgi:UDP-N-acetylmuramoyl-L-alanyl-D-glutamate--2,6-diaminopimelate ligase